MRCWAWTPGQCCELKDARDKVGLSVWTVSRCVLRKGTCGPLGSPLTSPGVWHHQGSLDLPAQFWRILQKPEHSCSCVAVLPEPVGLCCRRAFEEWEESGKEAAVCSGGFRQVERCLRNRGRPTQSALCPGGQGEQSGVQGSRVRSLRESLKCSRQPAT